MLGSSLTLNTSNVFDYLTRLEEGFLPLYAYSPIRAHATRMVRLLDAHGPDAVEAAIAHALERGAITAAAGKGRPLGSQELESLIDEIGIESEIQEVR